MPERGIDISEWQAGMDVERVVRENNLSFVMVRTNYGSDHDDGWFHRHCDGAERGGAIVTPYVYPLATDTRGSIDDAHRIISGRYNRLIVDWEVGSGGGDHLRAAHDRAWEQGYNTPLVYDPAWYYQQVGSPNVDWMGQSGRIGGRWKSWYPDNIPGSFDEILKKLPASVWGDNRGGLATRIVQFTSSGRLSGWGGNLDLNYFPGSRGELEALLGGSSDMALNDSFDRFPHGNDGETVRQSMTLAEYFRYTESAIRGLYELFFRVGEVRSGADTYDTTGKDLLRYIDLNGIKLDKLLEMTGQLTDDEAKILGALRALTVGGTDPNAIAQALLPLLSSEVRSALVDVLRHGTDKESA